MGQATYPQGCPQACPVGRWLGHGGRVHHYIPARSPSNVSGSIPVSRGGSDSVSAKEPRICRLPGQPLARKAGASQHLPSASDYSFSQNSPYLLFAKHTTAAKKIIPAAHSRSPCSIFRAATPARLRPIGHEASRKQPGPLELLSVEIYPPAYFHPFAWLQETRDQRSLECRHAAALARKLCSLATGGHC